MSLLPFDKFDTIKVDEESSSNSDQPLPLIAKTSTPKKRKSTHRNRPSCSTTPTGRHGMTPPTFTSSSRDVVTPTPIILSSRHVVTPTPFIPSSKHEVTTPSIDTGHEKYDGYLNIRFETIQLKPCITAIYVTYPSPMFTLFVWSLNVFES